MEYATINDFKIAINVRKAVAEDAYCHPGSRIGSQSVARVSVPESLWVRVATQEALLAGIKPSLVLGTCTRKEAREARWKAWKRVLDQNPKFSVKSLGTVSGYHHTTILCAMQRMRDKQPLTLAS